MIDVSVIMMTLVVMSTIKRVIFENMSTIFLFVRIQVWLCDVEKKRIALKDCRNDLHAFSLRKVTGQRHRWVEDCPGQVHLCFGFSLFKLSFLFCIFSILTRLMQWHTLVFLSEGHNDLQYALSLFFSLCMAYCTTNKDFVQIINSLPSWTQYYPSPSPQKMWICHHWQIWPTSTKQGEDETSAILY